MRVLFVGNGIGARGGIDDHVQSIAAGIERDGIGADFASGADAVRLAARAGDATVVHVFGCLPSATIFGALAAGRLGRSPVVWTPTFHPARLASWEGSGPLRAMEAFDRVAPLAARVSDVVVAASEAERDHFLRAGARRVEVIPCAVRATSDRLAGVAWARARALVGAGDGPLVLLVAAHSPRRKGVEFAAETIRLVRSSLPEALLVAVGGGADTAIGGREGVVSLGWCAPDLLDAAYASADVLFVPSLYEQLSIAALESWSRSVPVVVTDRVALAPLVDHVAGEVVPYGHVPAAADALLRLLSSPELSDRLGRAGRAIVEERFLLDRQLERWIALYRGLFRAGEGAGPAPG